jgi:hypothetical protein
MNKSNTKNIEKSPKQNMRELFSEASSTDTPNKVSTDIYGLKEVKALNYSNNIFFDNYLESTEKINAGNFNIFLLLNNLFCLDESYENFLDLKYLILNSANSTFLINNYSPLSINFLNVFNNFRADLEDFN